MNFICGNKSSEKLSASAKCPLLLCITCILAIGIITMLNTKVTRESLSSYIPTSFSFTPIEKSIYNYTLSTFESFICDNTRIDRFPQTSTTPSNNSFDVYRKNNLENYCSIVPIPRGGWTKATNYTEKDITFVIFTAAVFFHTRATASRDTWISRVTNYYFLSATPYPYLPVSVVPNAGEDKLSNMKKLFYGFQLIYQQQMKLSVSNRQKWFYIAGCDTFILPHHLLKRLDGLDYTEPLLVGGHSGHHTCLGDINPKITVEFPSGGAGFFLSMKLFEMMQPNLTNFVENVWPRTSEISDVALTCLAAQLGVRITRREGFWSHAPGEMLRAHGRARFHKDPEPNGFHYVQPDEMYALDEFYVNQYMDRLISDRNWNELIQFTRRFVSSHYELLRKKRRECTLPKI
ncbi:unnamed protein product [Rotaria magnacalcarata]|uniref:Fringe-like glycosyltransferase domain-containing protein n=1 Tax=Rotaria magnacalcarata TaxID=392030 RepID=A0A816VN22_9BILA|nr:unnamed protein product [Rotaria magnacalcarata]